MSYTKDEEEKEVFIEFNNLLEKLNEEMEQQNPSRIKIGNIVRRMEYLMR